MGNYDTEFMELNWLSLHMKKRLAHTYLTLGKIQSQTLTIRKKPWFK